MKAALPASDFMLSMMLCFERPAAMNMPAMPRAGAVPRPRAASGIAMDSTLITSAPRSPSRAAAKGPATATEMSRTLTPASLQRRISDGRREGSDAEGGARALGSRPRHRGAVLIDAEADRERCDDRADGGHIARLHVLDQALQQRVHRAWRVSAAPTLRLRLSALSLRLVWPFAPLEVGARGSGRRASHRSRGVSNRRPQNGRSCKRRSSGRLKRAWKRAK